MYKDKDDRRVEIVKAVYDQFHNSVELCQERKNKVTIGVIGLFFLFSGYIFQKTFSEIHKPMIFVIIPIIVVITASTIIFLIKNHEDMVFCCRIIIGMEKMLGLYEPGFFIKASTPENALPCTLNSLFGNQPSDKITILPPKALEWGQSGTRLLIWWNIVGVLISAVIAMSALLTKFEYYDNTGLTDKPKQDTAFAQSGPLFPDHVNVVLHAPDGGVQIQPSSALQNLITKYGDQIEQINQKIDRVLSTKTTVSKPPPNQTKRLENQRKKRRRR